MASSKQRSPAVAVTILRVVDHADLDLLSGDHDGGMHALPTDSVSLGYFGQRDSDPDLEDGPVPLLGHAQLPQHETGASRIKWSHRVAHQAEPDKGITPICYDLLYIFKGARSAPGGGWPPHRDSAARANRRLERGAASARSWSASRGETVARRAPAAFLLALAGHVGAGEHSPPPATARAARPNIGSGARGHGGGPSLRRPHREALQDQPLGRSLRSRRCAMPLAPLRLSLGRDSLGANRRDGRVRTLAGPVATACSNHPEPCRSQAVTTGGESHVRYRAGHIGRVLQAGGQGFKSP